MSFPQFGEIVEENALKGSYPEFGEKVEEPSRLRSLLSAFPKGVLKAARGISPLPNLGPIPEKLASKLTEQFLPTQERLPEQLLERTGKVGTYLAGGEASIPSKVIRSGIGALAGQVAKETGGGELAQDIAELSSMSLPELSKNILSKKSQQRVVNFLRSKGFSENEITPLIQSPKKLARYAKFASKGEKTNKLMRDIYGKFENVYSSIREQGENLPSLSGEKLGKFERDFQETIDKIPKYYRRKMSEEVKDLMNSEMKFTDLVDFNQAINAEIGSVKGGKAVLGLLKEPIDKGLASINPQLASDYKLANELYRHRIDVTNHLRTKQIDDLIDIGEAGTVVAGIADQNLGLIAKVVGASGMRRLAREMLINPKLQNISSKMLQAVKENKIPVALKLYKTFKDEVPKDLREELP